jgi:hypothetical protein
VDVALIAACGAGLAAGCNAGRIEAVGLDPKSPWSNLLAYWSFDDGGGTTLADLSGNGRAGMVLPGATWAPGRFGGALHFDGTTLAEVNVPSFPQVTGSWSVAGWVNAPAGDTGDSYATIVSTENLQVGGWEFNLRLVPPGAPPASPPVSSLYQFAYWIGPGQSNYVNRECDCFTPSQWVHVAAVLDAGAQTLSFYRNGVFQGSTLAATAVQPGNSTLYFGRWANDDSRRLTGDLDDFVIYNRPLEQAEVQRLAREPMPPMVTPP